MERVLSKSRRNNRPVQRRKSMIFMTAIADQSAATQVANTPVSLRPSVYLCVQRPFQRRGCKDTQRTAEKTPSQTPSLSKPPKSLRFGSPFSRVTLDRKSTRLNSSHSQISYAVFCLKKK